jgi:L-lactate utilization protein LutC
MSGAVAAGGLIEGAQEIPNARFRSVASRERIDRTAEALRRNGITPYVEASAPDALARFRAIVPEGAEVFTTTSRTLDDTGIAELVNRSGRYRSVRAKLATMDRKTQHREMLVLGATAEYVAGSVHAITEHGQVVIASATGSQLAPYAASAAKVVWVVGAQKIVRDLDEAFARIREYAFPLENARAQQAYGTGSRISKLLIVQHEANPGRSSVILVASELGF